MDRKTLESAATRVTNLRGLLGIPGGLLFMAVGLGNLGWGPFSHDWFFIVVVLALVMSFAYINRYYDQHYGRATLTSKREITNQALNGVFFGLGLVGGILLDFNFDVPISLFTICFALAMFGWYAVAIGLKAHHFVIWGALLIIGLIPMWGSLDDQTSVAWLPIGAAAIICGLMDHLTLARSYTVSDDNA